MIRFKYQTPGTPPATLAPPRESAIRRPLITLIQDHQETFFEGQFDNFEDLMRRFDPHRSTG